MNKIKKIYISGESKLLTILPLGFSGKKNILRTRVKDTVFLDACPYRQTPIFKYKIQLSMMKVGITVTIVGKSVLHRRTVQVFQPPKRPKVPIHSKPIPIFIQPTFHAKSSPCCYRALKLFFFIIFHKHVDPPPKLLFSTASFISL